MDQLVALTGEKLCYRNKQMRGGGTEEMAFLKIGECRIY